MPDVNVLVPTHIPSNSPLTVVPWFGHCPLMGIVVSLTYNFKGYDKVRVDSFQNSKADVF